jgi:antitoxin HicB
MTKSRPPCLGSSLDSFLEEEGLLEETRAVAIKEVIAWQIQEAMKARKQGQNGRADANQPRPA